MMRDSTDNIVGNGKYFSYFPIYLDQAKDYDLLTRRPFKGFDEDQKHATQL